MNKTAILEGVWVNAPASWSAAAVTPLWNNFVGWRIMAKRESGGVLRLPPQSKTWRHFE